MGAREGRTSRKKELLKAKVIMLMGGGSTVIVEVSYWGYIYPTQTQKKITPAERKTRKQKEKIEE